jgi:polysaccharide biosynthesis protein PslE
MNTMVQTADSPTSVGDLCRMCLRHPRKASLVFLLVVGATAVATMLWPRAYRAEGKLLVRLGRETTMLDPSAALGKETLIALPETPDFEINSVVELLGSRVLLERLVDTFGVGALDGSVAWPGPNDLRSAPKVVVRGNSAPAPSNEELYQRELALIRLAKNLRVEPVAKSNVIQISYDGPSPALAQAVVQRLMDWYLEEHSRLNCTHRSHEFLSKQQSASRDQLTRLERDLLELKNQADIVAPDRQRTLIAEQKSALEANLVQVGAERSASEAQIKTLGKELRTLPRTRVSAETKGIEDRGVAGMREQLFAVEVEQQKLAAQQTAQHPRVMFMRQQIDELRSMLDKREPTRTEVVTSPNPQCDEAELTAFRQQVALAALRAKEDQLRGQLVSTTAQLQSFNKMDLRVAKLQREIDLADAAYRKYSENLEQARVDEARAAERISSINIAQPASYNVKKVRPWVTLNLLVGIVLGVLGAFGTAYLAEQRNPRQVRVAAAVNARPGLIGVRPCEWYREHMQDAPADVPSAT